ncbi:acyltransferase family protein [Streptomyces sp. HNM0574]|uniref:acyltransferase family protein n=1 Tax=Streptomyces sp. HNM0574 TaxID=2714954 RepID=UPI00146A15AA|nr:acyltransferase family protein [Streptomyces sp. HNM0574]NLU68576.1 acyltransferase family protein [Streptomyces sp. HNM0574]
MTDDVRTPPAAGPVPASAPRLPHLDNLRIALTALVVLHHAAVTYGNIPVWYYTEPAKDASGGMLDLFVMVNQAFFMGFFFLIAGYFTPGSHDRKGGRAFFRDRLKRLGIPLLAFVLVLRPLVNFSGYQTIRDAAAAKGEEFPYWLYYLVSWDPGPMWFVEVLLLLSLGYVLLRRRRDRGAAQAPRPGPPRPRTVLAFGAGLALVTWLWRMVLPMGAYIPVLGLPTPGYLPQYVSFFAVGVLAFRRGWAGALSRRAGYAGAAVAVLATLAYLPVVLGARDADLAGFGTWQSAAASLWESAFAIGAVLALTVLFRERFAAQGPFRTYLTRHAFTVYLIHPLVLVALALLLAGVQAPALAKFALLAALALPLCWAAAWAVRHLPGADRVL